MNKAISKLEKMLGGAKSVTLQGGSRLHDHGDQPTILLRETMKHRKLVRRVTHVLDSEADCMVVRDHCGEVWRCKRMGDGNYRAII